ncbi:NrdH-redoxin [bacterium CG_4_10_14_0_2_um_filter_33_32]|nr:MAG: NrdH-redoxin [bacterium CG2_30_33_46]PIR67903.1 MAG: NrdH-redoxin [bacterium CG10_big_fil_rev_8_21_14_0_10_33_18]PIU76324.1 MAG: NrdH-redoxin [bacterium CG06_land_8_20_14_3_00_33_50]PIW81016.1 MAG: NrdH-redoxin [bacterium CG_4_8_14_3_um_filter_33_28]PIY85462.1 MAG: NrdH-redoxin [bacterium CG_4_10_14_0_8_um_filter_33_57]PIZ85191.1 MAG: NrdH-redoxin [bacterium CG_4_10_14_0_2_um_filter_33_32]PJA72305.1 MAG: NrdH-redoxin [bacterium CG_4_9_14_3_um_filter_33_26]
MVNQHNVKVFSTPTCPWCIKVKEYLDEKQISHEDIDVSSDKKAAMEMVDKSKQMGVPQIWIDDEVVVGFDKEKINQLLGL